MKCPNCGCEFDEGIFCPECGTKVIANDINPQDSIHSDESSVSNEEKIADTETAQEIVMPQQIEGTPMAGSSPENEPIKGKKTKEKKSKEKEPKAPKEKKKGGCLKAILIAIAIIVVLIIIICMIPSSDSSSNDISQAAENIEGDTEPVSANEVIVEEAGEDENQANSWMPVFADGISPNYDMSYVRMKDPYEVISYFNDNGYQYVYLKDHEVNLMQDDNGFYGGTSDIINATASFCNKDNLFYMIEDMRLHYTYWGDQTNEWLFVNSGYRCSLVDFSAEGFNKTYWGLRGSNSTLSTMADEMFGDEIELLKEEDFNRDIDYDQYIESLNIGLYLYLDNFENFSAQLASSQKNASLTLSYNNGGEIPSIAVTLVLEGKTYEKTFPITNAEISSGVWEFDEGILDAGTRTEIRYSGDITIDSSLGIDGTFGEVAYMVLLTEDEYETGIQNGIGTGSTASEVAEKAEEVIYDNIFEKLYDTEFNKINEYEEYGSYLFYDFDDDGIYELILGHGTNSSDYSYDFYTIKYDNRGYWVDNMAILDGEQTFYEAPDGNGIFAVYGKDGHEVVKRIIMGGQSLTPLSSSIEIDQDIDIAAGEEYYSNDKAIEESDITDKSLLKRVTASMASRFGNGLDDEDTNGVDHINISSNSAKETSNDSNEDYVLPDSDKRYYSTNELNGLSKDQLRIARNEIYARHGRMFDSADLDEYFRSKSWYNPTVPASQFDENVLNDYEKENAKTIRSMED